VPEWLGFGFGLLQVILARVQRSINFFAGLISVSCYIWVFYGSGLYAECLLNMYYWLMSIWGLIRWNHAAQQPIRFSNSRDHIQTLLIFILCWIILFGALSHFTDSTVPFMDAWVSALAWAGTWLLVNRKVENWLWLSCSNLLAIPLLWYKDLALTTLLTVIYLIFGILGYLSWKKSALQLKAKAGGA